jgi:exosortase H (IPTLxxWG-CTERM-specific)
MRAVWQKPETRFVLLFLVLVTVGFAVIALQPVNDGLVVPYTAAIARASGAVLGLLGEDITVTGCDLRSPRFAVTIYNGCNGLIASLVFSAAVIAFPTSWRAKVVGVLAGMLAIQLLNLIRIVSLYFIGAFLPEYFNEAHIVIWQSLVIIAAVAMWIAWARFGVKQIEDRQ